jgi:LuxR family maltose regulon positive regulatory protein
MTQNVTYYSERLKTALQAMLKSPLTVVEAPMGYGKSVAVDGFLRELSVGLVATKARESAPESFWPDFCRALAKEIPHAGDVAASLSKLGLPHDIAQTGAALELFRQVYFPRQTFLVFDDCHLLPRSFVDFCESLAGCALPNLHLVCITQHSWAGGREFLRARSAPSLIDRHVLALTPAEIRAHFALFAVSISMSVAQELHASTGGWISAVYLGLLWYREHGDLADFPKNVATRMKETIRETVYAPLSNEARCLLFALLPLERFTDGQALRLHGEDASSLLLELTRKNAFVVFDLKSKTYSLHAIFRQFLLDEFHAEGVLTDARRREIYRACGDAQKDAGELAAAMESWYKAEAFEHALAVLESDMSRHLVTERAALYTALFKDCPQEILERHIGASFKYALAAFSAGDFAAFATQMRWLSGHCAALPPGKEGDRWRGELHVLLALTAFNDIAAMSAHHRRAFALLGEPTGLYGQDSPWTLGCPSVLFMFYRESGGLREELALMRECMPHYYRLTSRHGAGAEFLMEAEALFCAGDFARAGEVLAHGQGMAERHNQLGNEFCALFLRLRLAFVAGDAAALFGDGEQDGLLAVMRGLILRGRDYFLLYTADLCEGWLYALLGLPEKIPQWLFLPLGGRVPCTVLPGDFSISCRGAQGFWREITRR